MIKAEGSDARLDCAAPSPSLSRLAVRLHATGLAGKGGAELPRHPGSPHFNQVASWALSAVLTHEVASGLRRVVRAETAAHSWGPALHLLLVPRVAFFRGRRWNWFEFLPLRFKWLIACMKTINGSNYQKHQLYPAIARAVAEMIKTTSVVSPVEVLLRLERITKAQYEDWRFRPDSLSGVRLHRKSVEAERYPAHPGPPRPRDRIEAVADCVSQMGPRG